MSFKELEYFIHSSEDAFTRRRLFSRTAKLLPKIMPALIPFGLTGIVVEKAKAGTKQLEISRLLNVLLQMEFVLRSLYSLTEDNPNLVPNSYSNSINEIFGHHRGHVLLLKNRIFAIKTVEVAPRVTPNFDVLGLDPRDNFDDFLQVAQVLEDAMASLYKKVIFKIRKLDSDKLLQRFLLQSHTAEARHSGYIRMIRADRGVRELAPWTSTGSKNVVLPEFQEIYENEDTIIQNEIDITSLSALPQSDIKEAWDEPCTNEAINNLFVLFRVQYY